MDAIDLLREKGLKKTAQRVMLISLLQRQEVALAEEDIKQDMGVLYDRITFYRTVQTLMEAGLIHRIAIDNKTVKYALNDDSTHSKEHSHFYCERCHSITCLGEMPKISYTLPDGFVGMECELLIKGICSQCRK